MAVPEQHLGYQCEFLDTVPDELFCKKCTLVARRISTTDCCGESFCRACLADTNLPCPSCGVSKFSSFELVKFGKRISSLRVYCSKKGIGCTWSGTLDRLDTHLDPQLDNCQYVDTKCPLNCLQPVPKNKVDQHVAQECMERPYVCQHCGFKATYEEVIGTHLPKCKYVPLQCPNMCGVSCDRELMEDHMKICRLEEVECEFSSVGCDGRFIREDQDEHSRHNSQKHLTLTASLAVATREQLLQKIQEQDKKYSEEEEKLTKKVAEQDKKLNEQEKKLEEHDSKLKILEQALLSIVAPAEKRTFENTQIIGLNRSFMMTGFSAEKNRDKVRDWMSPAMYTHMYGYKFCIGVNANGISSGRGKSVDVDVWYIPGEFDDKLKWPAKARFHLELVNQQGGENIKVAYNNVVTWCRRDCVTRLNALYSTKLDNGKFVFAPHSELRKFLKNDTLHFFLPNVEIL